MTHNWEAGTQYNSGDRVRYHGSTYKIVQAHRSQGDWAPDVVPALWARCSDDNNDSSHDDRKHHKDSCHDDHKHRDDSCHENRKHRDNSCDDDREQHHRQENRQDQYQQPQPYMQAPPQPQQQQQQQQQFAQPAQPAQPAPQQQQQQQQPAQQEQQVVPPNSDDPRKQKQDGFNIGSLHFGDDALKIGGGLLGTAAAIGIGAFAFDRYRDAKENKGDEQWGAENWLADARRRQGEYLEAIKGDAHLAPLSWILTEGGAIPQGAIQAGQDARTSEPYYVARAYYKHGVWIGKAAAGQGDGCRIAYGGKEVVVQQYEILLGFASAVRWIDGQGGLRNTEQYRMVEGGRTAEGAPVYVAQGHLGDNSVIPGGVTEAGKGCHCAYRNDESVERSYRFLTYA